MWLKKLLNRWKTKGVLETNDKASLYIANRKLCEELLNKLNVSKYASYTPIIGLSTIVKTRYATIEEYNEKIKNTIINLKRNIALTPDWDNVDETEISLDRFLTSSDGFYLDNVLIISQFKKNGLELCKLMEESDTATYGIHEHNLRMLTKLFINLSTIISTLIKVSNNI